MNYLVVSSRQWHKKGFESLKSLEGNWEWVDEPAKLMSLAHELSPRYIFFLHWSHKVPDEIWMKYECVCFHMTDLPFGRGGSPLQNLISSGHQSTTLTAIRMIKEFDAGPIYTKRNLSLSGRAVDIYIKAGLLSFEIIDWIVKNQPKPYDQKGDVTVFKRRTPTQSRLPITSNLSQLFDHIRMLDAPGYPYAYIQYGVIRIEFSHAELKDGALNASVRITSNHNEF